MRTKNLETEVIRVFVQGILQPESPKILENEGQKVTVIFNQRICANVDLEIGKLICIHPPWYAH